MFAVACGFAASQSDLSLAAERVTRVFDTSLKPKIIIHHHSIEFTTQCVLTVGPAGPGCFGTFFSEILHWRVAGRGF